MSSDILQILGVLGLIAGLGSVFAILVFVGRGQRRRLLAGDVNPMPFVPLIGIPRADVAEQREFLETQVADLDRLPWRTDIDGDRQQAERAYQGALDALAEAEGHFARLPPIIEMLIGLPRDLAMSGTAAVILRMAYLQDQLYIPQGVREALRYTSASIKANPLSVEAWIARLSIASSVDDARYHVVADDALRKVRLLNPSHPLFAAAEASYHRSYGTNEQFEASLQRAISSAPSLIAKRTAYDRLARLYGSTNRRDQAIATYQQLVREFPEGSAWIWHNYSIQLYNAKRYQEALDASNRALSFGEFGAARTINNKARATLGMALVEPAPMES